MKNKILLVLFLLSFIVITGCTKQENVMYIDCENEIIIQSEVELKVYYEEKQVPNENLKWTVSDYSIATIKNNILYAKGYGKVTIGVIDSENTNHYCAKEIEIVPPYVTDIEVIGTTELIINRSTKLTAKVLPEIIDSPILWESSNEEVIIVHEGEVYAVGVGEAYVIVKCEDFVKKIKFIVNPEPTFVDIYGDTTISINEIASFTYNIDEDIILESSDPEIVEIVDDVVLGKGIGTTTITAYKVSNPEVKGTIELTVNGSITKIEMTTEELIQIEEIMNSMTTEELVGQMFNVGINMYSNRWETVEIDKTTGLPYAQFTREDPKVSVSEYLKDYKFGNFTIKSSIATTRENLLLATQTLNQMANNNSQVNPFITLEYTGGNTISAVNSLPYNQSLAASSNDTINAVSSLFASELQAVGINSVMSVYANTNPNVNNLLTTYGSDISKAITTASLVNKAYSNYGITLIPDLSITNNYLDDRSLEELQSTDFKLIEAAIQNGTQMISLPLAEYISFGGDYAFKNEAFIQDYIRKELAFNGVLVIDNSILYSLVYGGTLYNDVVDAINKGVDMINFDITFTTSRWSDYNYIAQQYLGLYNHIIKCVNEEKISLDRIKQSVARILLVKLRNNVLEEKQENDFDFDKVKDQLLNYLPKFITAHGEMYQIEKSDKVMFISESYGQTGTSNSLGDNFSKYARTRGYSDVQVFHTDALNVNDVLNKAKSCNKIFISVDSIYDGKTVGYRADAISYLEFVNNLKQVNSNICFIFTGNSSEANKIDWVKNYIFLYDFYEDDFASLCRVLTQEAQPNIK